jgi:hypothetical protein
MRSAATRYLRRARRRVTAAPERRRYGQWELLGSEFQHAAACGRWIGMLWAARRFDSSAPTPLDGAWLSAPGLHVHWAASCNFAFATASVRELRWHAARGALDGKRLDFLERTMCPSWAALRPDGRTHPCNVPALMKSRRMPNEYVSTYASVFLKESTGYAFVRHALRDWTTAEIARLVHAADIPKKDECAVRYVDRRLAL